jgi:hypothetical protein
VPEFLTNGGNPGRSALRCEGRDQIAQPRPQVGGPERLVIGQGRERAKEPLKAAQPACLSFRDALAGAAPPGRDPVIEQGEARIGELQ